jgi:peptide chain release factor 3
MPVQPSDGRVGEEARRRRTFAIISHPDAGKTTLTEKVLLYGGALREAGQVQGKGRPGAVSDWMALERERGISVTSSVLRFEHDGAVLNLLDTPGHRDFAEDTLRVLTAVECAVVLLDAARGVEDQTRMLFEVARARRIPIVTFVNKYDRPGLEPLGMLDHISDELGLEPVPLTWPVGEAGRFLGLLDRPEGRALRFERTAHGAHEAPEVDVDLDDPPGGDPAWTTARDELELAVETLGELDPEAFRAGRQTPVLFGSAMWNFGVRQLLRTVVAHAPAPGTRAADDGTPHPVAGAFSGQVFKVQANIDPRHRDKLAFLRVCSGRFERGAKATVLRTGRPVTMAHAHQLFGQDREAVDEAFPGDVVGLSGIQDIRVGDTLATDPAAAPFTTIPTVVPERLVLARPQDVGRRKQFVRGLEQLDHEGVVHLLRRTDRDDPLPVLGAVGDLQLEVCRYRMEHEFGCPLRVEPSPWSVARRVASEDAGAVTASGRGTVLERADGTLVAAFPETYHLRLFTQAHPDVALARVIDDHHR